MRTYEAAARAHTIAAPGTVYALLRHGPGWPEWIDVDSMEPESEGDGGGPITRIMVTRLYRQFSKGLAERAARSAGYPA